MATFRDVQLNAIDKKILTKQAEDLYKATNCELDQQAGMMYLRKRGNKGGENFLSPPSLGRYVPVA